LRGLLWYVFSYIYNLKHFWFIYEMNFFSNHCLILVIPISIPLSSTVRVTDISITVLKHEDYSCGFEYAISLLRNLAKLPRFEMLEGPLSFGTPYFLSIPIRLIYMDVHAPSWQVSARLIALSSFSPTS